MRSIILLRCCDAQTPLDQLQARRRWADRIITVWLASTVRMVEVFATITLVGFSTIEGIILLASTCVCLLTSVPAIILIPAIGEFDRELAARGALPAQHTSMESRVPRYVVRALVFAALTGVIIAVLR